MSRVERVVAEAHIQANREAILKLFAKPPAHIVKAGYDVFFCMAYRDIVKEMVHKYQREILEKHQFKSSNAPWEPEKVVLDGEDAYKLAQADFNIYLKECQEAAHKQGFKVEYGYCPLLIAESTVSLAERTLIDALAPTLAITYKGICSNLKAYKKYIDIQLKWLAAHCETVNITNSWEEAKDYIRGLRAKAGDPVNF